MALKLFNDSGVAKLQAKDGEESITATADGAVKLYYDNAEKLATTATGVDVTGDLKFNSGYGSAVIGYGVRAWVNFDGIGTVAIRESGNVSSITDLDVGKFRINFSTNMPDVNYAPILATNYNDAGARVYTDVYTLAVGSFEISVRSAANAVRLDPEGSFAAVIR